MKSVVKYALAIIVFFAVVLAGGQNPDGSCNVLWTMKWLAVAAAAALALNRLVESKQDEGNKVRDKEEMDI